jgi:tRNA A37 methylthiotransferase MiaB
MSLVEEVGFDQSFSFVYSARPGTPAAALPDDTPQAVKLERLARLQARLHAQGFAISEGMVGTRPALCSWNVTPGKTRSNSRGAPRTIAGSTSTARSD